MAVVRVKSVGNFTQVVTTTNHAIVADEPEHTGGDDLGFSPYELLLSALGT